MEFIKDLLAGRGKRILYVYGKPGIGKTTVVKHVINRLEEETTNATACYISCSSTTPSFAVKAIYETLFSEGKKRLPSAFMISKIKRAISQDKESLVIVLDNFDQMKDFGKLLWNIYDLMQDLVRVGVILISTSEQSIHNVGGRLFSRINPEYLAFHPYDEETLYEILKSRIMQAYGKMIIEEKALSKLCEFVANEGEGSARYLLQLFLSLCESEQEERRISINAVERILNEERVKITKMTLNAIKTNAPRMYEILKIIATLCKTQQSVNTGLLKDEIRKKGIAVSGRSLDYYLNNLESKGLIKLEKVRKRGLTRKIDLCIDAYFLTY